MTPLKATALKQRDSARGKNPYVLDEAVVSKSKKHSVSSSSSSSSRSEDSTIEAATGSDCPTDAMENDGDSDSAALQEIIQRFYAKKKTKPSRTRTVATKLKKKPRLSSESDVSERFMKAKKKKVVVKKK